MPDTFDPYREALVMEAETQWPEEYDEMPVAERARLELLLHSQPEQAAGLEYVRTHTGFCRKIVVTPDDLVRLQN